MVFCIYNTVYSVLLLHVLYFKLVLYVKWNEKDEQVSPGEHKAEPKFGEGRCPYPLQAEPQEARMC